jgi:hypothetical protein
MKTFNPIHRDFVAPADLATLDATYNTLEQGHKEAVQTASAIQMEMAKLDLNPAENGWRQSKVNEIQTALQNGTIKGNSYAALDDLIAMSGQIFSDPALLGRLNANKEYKAFQTQLKERTDIPEAYKPYFEKRNPYQYQDEFDEAGNIIGGTEWKPTETPVSTVDISQLMAKAIQMTAKEAGSGNIVQFVDKDNNITTDPTKAAYGNVFNDVTRQWERLSKAKIDKTFAALIDSTPGARESINQDYKVQTAYNLEAVAANGGAPVPGPTTDAQGRLLTQAQWLAKITNPISANAAYYKEVTQTTYGDGLAAFQTIGPVEQLQRFLNEGSTNIGTGNYDKDSDDEESGDGTPHKTSNSSATLPIMLKVKTSATPYNNFYTAAASISDILKKYDKDVSFLYNNKYINLTDIDDSSFDKNDKYELASQIRTYNRSLNSLNNALVNVTDAEGYSVANDADFFRRQMMNGMIVMETDKQSKYDKEVLNLVYELGLAGDNPGDEFGIRVENDSIFNNIVEKLGGIDNINKMGGITLDSNNRVISVDKTKTNLYTKVFDAVNQSGSQSPVITNYNGDMLGDAEKQAKIKQEMRNLGNLYGNSYFHLGNIFRKVDEKYGEGENTEVVEGINHLTNTKIQLTNRVARDDGTIKDPLYQHIKIESAEDIARAINFANTGNQEIYANLTPETGWWFFGNSEQLGTNSFTPLAEQDRAKWNSIIVDALTGKSDDYELAKNGTTHLQFGTKSGVGVALSKKKDGKSAGEPTIMFFFPELMEDKEQRTKTSLAEAEVFNIPRGYPHTVMFADDTPQLGSTIITKTLDNKLELQNKILGNREITREQAIVVAEQLHSYYNTKLGYNIEVAPYLGNPNKDIEEYQKRTEELLDYIANTISSTLNISKTNLLMALHSDLTYKR